MISTRSFPNWKTSRRSRNSIHYWFNSFAIIVILRTWKKVSHVSASHQFSSREKHSVLLNSLSDGWFGCQLVRYLEWKRRCLCSSREWQSWIIRFTVMTAQEATTSCFSSQGHTLICTLEAGAAFGESILYDTPRNATVITSSVVMLLRVEQKDFKILWEVMSVDWLICNFDRSEGNLFFYFSGTNSICKAWSPVSVAWRIH